MKNAELRIKNAIAGYKDYLTNEKKHVRHTVKLYAGMAEKLFQWANENGLSQITYHSLLSYIRYLQALGNTPRHINSKLSGIRHYFDYENHSNNKLLNKVNGHNPAANLHVKGVKRKIRSHCFTKPELESLYQSYEGKEKAMLGLLIYQGLQSIELTKIEAIHLDLEAGTVYVPAMLRSQSRLLKLDGSQMGLLCTLAKTRKDKPLIGKALAKRLNKLMKELRQINPDIRTAQQLRGSMIVHWLQSEGLRQAQYKAGHKTVAGTELYQQVNVKDLQQQIELHHPLK